ncbi:methyl-accepting chemotaxis protein [Pseudomonas sp. G2-4]|uniref:methyl-accepting chemotaxis protein n=1 Tax=Pseudomonas sp. G2-4 TaxID=1506334 RepID=UPI0024B8F9C4|nr:methyl-accepting chemotaxis protein [Pseudomonas sp. G2-4]WHS57722.1 methyl-accepting chemotaxis protein [Pseudomonas sp. G2-4]
MRLTIYNKVVLLSVIPVLLLAALLSGLAVVLLQRSNDAQVKDTREMLISARKSSLENLVQVAEGAITTIYAASSQGDAQARDQAVAVLRKIGFGKEGYFWGYDSNSVRIFWADKDLKIGESFRGMQDPNGVYVVNELVRAAKEGSHFVEYSFPTPGSDKSAPKIGYAVYLAKWDLAFGASVNMDDIEREVQDVADASNNRSATLIQLMLGVGAALFLIIAIVSAWTARALVQPLHLIKNQLDEIASGDGDLTNRLPVSGDDELGALANSFNRFVGKIHSLVKHVTETTGQLNQLVGAVADQAIRSENATAKQRHETDQVAAAINQMSAAAHEVAQSAQGAATAANEADSEGRLATQIVSHSVQSIHALVDELRHSEGALNQLQDDVHSIVKVLSVIRSIAEQTNLLALNAAIEAARAGHAGRGFAVVADEVRALASKTQQSTQEIQGMIVRLQQGTMNTVSAMRRSSEAGNSTSDAVGKATVSLNAIAMLISTINLMNTQIAGAAEEQTAVSEEINRSVHQIAVVVESVAEETRLGAETARSLATLSENLHSIVRQFKV